MGDLALLGVHPGVVQVLLQIADSLLQLALLRRQGLSHYDLVVVLGP